jgi:BolA family transcriptional regulator, general stress-responsive regulator
MRLKASGGLFMTIADTIRTKLIAALAPDALSIEDESSKHAGHSGARPGGETHFRVRIVSAEFEGIGRVERQRRVYAVLAEELNDRVHALALTTLTPKEAASR